MPLSPNVTIFSPWNQPNCLVTITLVIIQNELGDLLRGVLLTPSTSLHKPPKL